MKEKRPKINIELSNTDKFIELFGGMLLFFFWYFVIANYAQLPDTIPSHFNSAGETDGFSSKNGIFFLPALGTVLFIGMTFLNKYPHIFNYPTTITEENAKRQYTLATQLIRHLKVNIIAVFILIDVKTIRFALGKINKIELWVLFATVSVIFIPIIFYLTRIFRNPKE